MVEVRRVYEKKLEKKYIIKCDRCGKKIVECEDEKELKYRNLFTYPYFFYIDYTPYRCKKELCLGCIDKITKEIHTFLQKQGFVSN